MQQAKTDLRYELEERLRFEKLLANISTLFINLPANQIDDVIKDAQRSVCEFLNLDRSALFQVPKGELGTLVLTHVYQPPGSLSPPERMSLNDFWPWSLQKILRGETLTVSKMTEIPPKAGRDRESFGLYGTKSLVAVPLSIGRGDVFGLLTFAAMQEEREWPETVLKQFQLVAQIFANALQRKQTEKSLEERLQFEMLLAEISAYFVNLPADQIDDGIQNAQSRICELLDLDRSTLWQISEKEPCRMLQTHMYKRSGSLEPPAVEQRELWPWGLKRTLAGETQVISKFSDLQPDAGKDRESYEFFGAKSIVVVPLSVGKRKIIGSLNFTVLHEERDWSEADVRGFQLIAEVFGNALARKTRDRELRESEARLSMATNAAGAGLWIMELDTGHVWASPITRELFHLASDEELRYESFFKTIHPDDHEQVHKAVQQAIQSGENLQTEYRIVLPDESIRWIVVRGKAFHRSPGEPDRLMGVSLDITERKQMEGELRESLREIEALKQQLERENIYLQEEVKLLDEHKEIVGQSSAIKKILAQAEQVAQTDSTVLILGETGTGKELLARAIHRMSSRKDRPLVTVNCASLPPTLIESELFGRERGAYTGALTRMVGRFELADGSTLFLDEIGELPLDLQSKLLRVLEEGKFERLGSTKSMQVDVRIIAATNRNIEQEVEHGKFRQDLFYRLNVFPIVIPPLRKRPEDIPLLVRAVVKEFQKKVGKEIESIPKKTMQALQSYSWPGNVRELRNVIEHAMILSKDKTLYVQLPNRASSKIMAAGNLEDVERSHIVAVLEKTGWRIAGQGGAAEVLGLKRTTLQAKMKKLGIKRSNKEMPK
jgi:PAS domain S-box-containing protein